MITRIPFMLDIRLNGEDIQSELLTKINTEAKRHKKHPHDFSARVEMMPDPRGEDFGHYLVAEVTYLKGDLT